MMRHSLVSLLTLGSLALSVTARPAHAFGVQGGIKFVAVLGAAEGTELALDDSTQHELQRGHADPLGSLLFLGLVPGPGYRVRTTEAGGESHPVTVLDFAQHPGPAFYQAQTLVDGFQYIRVEQRRWPFTPQEQAATRQRRASLSRRVEREVGVAHKSVEARRPTCDAPAATIAILHRKAADAD